MAQWDPKKSVNKLGGAASDLVQGRDGSVYDNLGRLISETPLGQVIDQTDEWSRDIQGSDPTVKSEEERKAEQEAKAAQAEAAGMYDNITLPEAAALYDMPETLELSAGGFEAKQLEGDYGVGASKFDSIKVDPRYAESQMAALSGIEDIVNSEGLTATDKANLSRIESDVGRADRGRREAIQDRMRRQGMAGSGLDLLQQLSSGQAATGRQAQSGLDVAAMGQQRKDSALRDLGSMSTGMRGQEFGEEAQKAQAADQINQFNAGARFNKDTFNAGAQNQAGMFNTTRSDSRDQTNWREKQNVYRDNRDIENRSKRDAFHDDLTVRDKKSNAKLGHANYQTSQADRKAGQRNQWIQGASQMAGTGVQAYLGNPASDENLKTETSSLSESDIEQFLESVKPKKYRYKDQKEGQGQRVGFMAQDIENNPIGQAVVQEDGQGTKRIDNFNLMGALLDGMSHIHKKQKKLEDELPDTENEPVMIFGGS